MMSSKTFVLVLVCFILSNDVQAQLNGFDLKFMRHLSKEQKKIEMLTYLKQEVSNEDSLHYFLAKYHLQFQEDSNFIVCLQKSKPLFLADSKAVGFTSCYFLRSPKLSIERDKWFTDLGQINLTSSTKEICAIYSLKTKTSKRIMVEDYPALLQESIQHYKKASSKSPVKAALLSAIVPGLGKMYIGKFRIGVNAFAMNSIFALQTYESIKRFGVRSPLSIVNMLFSSFFYASTIYGSYRDARYYKHETLQQVYYDASDYYSTKSFPSLY